MLRNVDAQAILRGDRKTLEDVIGRRIRLRELYRSSTGVEQLCDIARSGCVFSQIGTDLDAAARHDFAVAMFDDIGLFDEANLEGIIRFLLSQPVFPEAEGGKEDTDV